MIRFPPRLDQQAALAAIALALPALAWAGPPYATDDPAPTDPGRWEIYDFAGGVHGSGHTAGTAGVDLNYGGAKDLQLTAVIPAEFQSADRPRWALGDIELAAKYRILHQEGPLGLDVALFPRLFLPTAADRHGERRASLLAPVWIGRDVGDWSIFGGGGYTFNPGAGDRSFWQGGLAITRRVNDRLNLGIETFRQGSDTADGKAFSRVGLGAGLRLNDHYSLLGAIGAGVENADVSGRISFYAALKSDF